MSLQKPRRLYKLHKKQLFKILFEKIEKIYVKKLL